MSSDELVVPRGGQLTEKVVCLGVPRQRFKLSAALLVLCAVIAYFPAINAGFIWDDDLLLTANPQMQNTHGLIEIWLGKNSCDYTPLTLTIFWLEKAALARHTDRLPYRQHSAPRRCSGPAMANLVNSPNSRFMARGAIVCDSPRKCGFGGVDCRA
jgi:hypothetical protein